MALAPGPNHRSSVADPVLFLTPGSRMGKNPEPGSGLRDKHPRSYVFENTISVFFGLKYLNSLMWIRDLVNPGSEMAKIESGIRDKHRGSATLHRREDTMYWTQIL